MKNTTWGFTLLELLVVVLVIGILAAVALPQYQKAVAKSRLTRLKPLVESMYQSSNFYYLTNGTYPRIDDIDLSIGGVSLSITNCNPSLNLEARRKCQERNAKNKRPEGSLGESVT